MKFISALFSCFLAVGVSAQKFEKLPTAEKLKDKDLSFAVTFDTSAVNADFAKGAKISRTMKDTNLMLRMNVGFDGAQSFQPVKGENLRFDILGSASPRQGTMSLWIKGTDYAPGTDRTDGKQRGNIALAQLVFSEDPSSGEGNTPDVDTMKNADKGKRMIDLRLYQYDSNVYFDWRSTEPPHTYGNVGRVNASMKGIKQDEWFNIVTTWDNGQLAIYLNGSLILSGALPPKHAKTNDFTTRSGFIGIKSSFYEDQHRWGTCIDDFKLYSRALTPVEVKNMYARLLKDKSAAVIQDYEVRLNGIDTGVHEKLDKLEAEFDFTALPEALAARLKAGKLAVDYKFVSPGGKTKSGQWTFSKNGECRLFTGIDTPGDYLLETSIDGKHKVVTKIQRPDLSFAYNGLGDEDEVPKLWKDFAVNGRTVTLWNRVYRFGSGPLPESIQIKGKELFVSAPELVIENDPIVWSAGKTSRTNRTVTFTGTGKSNGFSIDYSTTVEYDGMIRFDWTIKGRPEIGGMRLEWQVAPEFRKFLMTPMLQSPKKQTFSYCFGTDAEMLWLVSPKTGGFAYSYQHDANWIYDADKPVFFADRETGKCSVVMVQKKVKMPDAVPYEALFIATPTRPLPEQNRVLRFDDRIGLVHGGGDGGFTGVGTYEPHPTDFEVRMKDRRPGSGSVYGLANALTDENEVVKYLGKYWSIPRGAVCQMPWSKPLGNGKYERVYNTLLLFCNATAFPDYILNNQLKIYNHPYGDRIFQIYYDHCGSSVCRNSFHGCRFKDTFGREIFTNEMLTKRKLIQRTVALAHRYGRTVMCHGQRSFFPFQCGMADYWFPGEQHSAAVQRNIWCYTDEVPDEIWQSEYNRDVLGIGVVFLPALWYAEKGKHVNDKTTEAMIAMLQLHDVDSSLLWAKGAVFCRLWDILGKYGVDKKDTKCHLFYEDRTVKSSNPDVRVTWYECPGGNTVLFLSNKDIRSHEAEIDISGIKGGSFKAYEEYVGSDVPVVDGKFKIKVPKRSFRIVAFPPRGFYPVTDDFTVRWGNWRPENSDSDFSADFKAGHAAPPSMKIAGNRSGTGCFLKAFPVAPGKSYEMSVWGRQENGNKISLSIQGQKEGKFLGLPPVSASVPGGKDWSLLKLDFTVPAQGKWAECDKLLVTLGGGGPESVTWFDDFTMKEK